MLALAVDEAFHLLAREPTIGWDFRAISHQARTFFEAQLTLPAAPTGPTFAVDVRSVGGGTTRVEVRSGPLDPAVLAAAERGVAAIGGAGFDALVSRARSLVQVSRHVVGDARAPLVVAGVLASVLLAPIVPPDETTIYGVRGARTRLSSAGWPKEPS